ncbi:discoidin domain-containing protein [Paenibacillus sp. NAIST15-1]|uniref:endo-beta-N-acetylglucosaminidase n=1 Tax=Paenibacillus sp. NAIST15-1 TaxID=1605994 RepID=UPI0009353EF9|nr:discoidin domain-containing protein [Paenibacillus sp. NAIST15-1]
MKRLKPTILSRGQIKRKFALMLSTAMIAGSLAGFAGQAEAAQPHSSYWYPDTLLSWSAQTDKDAAFNRSSVKLDTSRVQGAKVNPNAKSDAKVMALASMYKSTSGAPSQGNDSFHGYAFSYWQYVDKLIMWGGSAGEGLIVPPSADVIDAAHKNGVPVYGTVFLPQKEHGGKIEWMRDLIQQREDGTFPVADKLIEVAKFYGFDGWFINQETQGGTPEDAQNMQKFLKYLQKIKPSNMEIIWYDSMVKDGPVKWQGGLTDNNKMFFQDGEERVADNMFIDFRWQFKKDGKYDYVTPFQNSPKAAEQLKRDRHELFAGMDLEGGGGYQGEYNFPVLFPEGQDAVTSLGLYRPDWAFNTTKTNDEFMKKEQRLWVGDSLDPSKTKANDWAWRGIAHDIVDKTVITKSDFVTHFNTGNGTQFSVFGKKVRDREWFNRSLQDVLPTWRWMVDESGQKIAPSFDFSNSFYGGSSLKLQGKVAEGASSNVKLYKTDVEATADMQMTLTYQSNAPEAADLNIGVAFEGAPDTYTFVKPSDTKAAGAKGDWTQATYDLSPYAGKKIVGISVQVEGKANDNLYLAHVGELAIRDMNEKTAPVGQVSDVRVIENDVRDGIYADARLTWTALGDDVQYYQVYRVKPDGSREFMGATGNNYYYVSEMKRGGDMEKTTQLAVVPVNRHYEEGRAAMTSFDWPEYPSPKADFEADKTFVAPGEEVQLTDKSSEVTTEWEWSFPGGTPETSKERNPKVSFAKEGTYEVKLTAKNAVGEDVMTKSQLITVSKEAAFRAEDLAKGAKTEASSFVNDSEAPQFAVDGEMHTKWCAVGNEKHWLKVDLGKAYDVTQFIVHHAEAGGESAAFNTREFTIQLSMDGENWTDAVKVTDNEKGTSKHAIAKTKARYVRLNVEKPTQGGDTAARIYGFEVQGIKNVAAE